MKSAQFDRIARPYRWLEYLTFGRLLERCRFHFAPQVATKQRALVLGDGDGRFLARLYRLNPKLESDAVDISTNMLDLLKAKVRALAGQTANLNMHCMDATNQLPTGSYDLIVTHFFFDCLTKEQAAGLVAKVSLQAQPGALWLVSDFQIPKTRIRPFAQLLVSGLYLGFRLFCGLRVKQIPDYHNELVLAGFSLVDKREFLMGILSTQLWQK